ncbi:MAG: methyltransferase domain-containing protein [Polyangiaceae bacterium]
MAESTGEFYKRHHQTNRYGFTILGEERGGWFAERVREASRALGKEKLDVLDVGCRDGTLTKLYAGSHEIRGLDVDPEAVRRARENGLDAREHDMNRGPLPFDEASFDVVVAGEVIEHLQWPQLVVEEIFRVLRPGGFLFGSVPNAFRLRNRVLFLLGREFEIDPTHLHWFSPASMRQLLGKFHGVDVDFQGGRRIRYSRPLMATTMLFRGRK